MKTYIVALFPVLCSLLIVKPLMADNLADSLYRECYKNNHNDTDRIKCIDLNAYRLAGSNPGAGLKLAGMTLNLANRVKWKRGMALAHNELGVNYKSLSQPDSAIHHYNLAMQFFGELKDIKAQSGVISNLSIVHKAKGDYVTALELLNKALTIQEKSGKPITKAIILENIGSVFMELKDYDKAQKYYIQARDIYFTENDSGSMARNLLNLGIIYDKNKNYDKAISNFQSALRIHKQLQNPASIRLACTNLGITYNHKQKFDSAVYYLNEAIKLSKPSGSLHALAVDYGNLGVVHLDRYKAGGNRLELKRAVYYLKEGYTLCDQIGFTPPQIEFAENLVEALELDGSDFRFALQVLKKGRQLKDSVYSNANAMKIHRLETEKEIALRENALQVARMQTKLTMQENLRHRSDKVVLVLGLLVCAMLIIILYLLYLYRRRLFRRRMHEISQFQSHQLRSPVVKILSISEELLTCLPDSEEYKKLMDMLRKSTDELDKRIHEVVKHTQ